MKIRALLPLTGLVALSALPARTAVSATPESGPTVISGDNVAERRSGGSPWVLIAEGHASHPGAEIRCPVSCILQIAGGGWVRLDADTSVRDLGPLYARVDGSSTAKQGTALALRSGAATAELAASAKPLVLESPDGAQFFVPPGSVGRVAVHGGGTLFGAIQAGGFVRAKAALWRPLAAGSSVEARGMTLQPGHSVLPAPRWRLSGLDEGPVGLSADGAGALVGAKWNAVDGASSYVVELAKDAAFSRLIGASQTHTTASSQILSPGTYYTRVAAIDERGLEGVMSPPRVLRVVPIELPAGSIDDLAARTFVLPASQEIRVSDPEIEFGLGNPRYRSTRFVHLRVDGTASQRLWVRLRGDATSASTVTLEPRGLHADVEITPRNARWPSDPLDIVVRLSDPSHRIDPSTLEPTLSAHIELEKIALHWERDGATFRAHVKPHLIGQNTIVRVEVTDEHQIALGRGFVEIEPSKQPRVAAR